VTKAEKCVAGGSLALLVFFWWRWQGPGRLKQELTIDANINSPTFGEPVYEGPVQQPEIVRLINESNERIAAHEATHDPDTGLWLEEVN